MFISIPNRLNNFSPKWGFVLEILFKVLWFWLKRWEDHPSISLKLYCTNERTKERRREGRKVTFEICVKSLEVLSKILGRLRRCLKLLSRKLTFTSSSSLFREKAITATKWLTFNHHFVLIWTPWETRKIINFKFFVTVPILSWLNGYYKLDFPDRCGFD